MRTRILIVDDLRVLKRPILGAEITYARTSAKALSLLQSDVTWDEVWLDHDLGEEDDIRPVVRWIDEYHPRINRILIVSMNPVGVKYIQSALEDQYSVGILRSSDLIVPEEKTATCLAEQVASQISFDLSYCRAESPREFCAEGIAGPLIDNADEGQTFRSPGEWCHDLPEWNDKTVDWRYHFFEAAVTEVLHECLEWFQIDGEPMIDPHGPNERDIYAVSIETAKALYSIVEARDRQA